MEMSQLRVTLTIAMTLLVTGLLCLPFEKTHSASFVILVLALILSALLLVGVSLVIFLKARHNPDDDDF